jgi:hypothetical protein
MVVSARAGAAKAKNPADATTTMHLVSMIHPCTWYEASPARDQVEFGYRPEQQKPAI